MKKRPILCLIYFLFLFSFYYLSVLLLAGKVSDLKALYLIFSLVVE